MSHIESKYPSLEEQHMLQVKRCIELGLNCVETDPKKRPTVGSGPVWFQISHLLIS